MRQHFVEDIRTHALAHPTKCALRDTRISIDYGSLERFSTSLAIHLLGLGCKAGDRVVVLANSQAILVAAIVGIFKAGCIHVPLDSRMPAARLQYILSDIAPAAVITEESLFDTVFANLSARIRIPILSVEDLEALLERDAAAQEVQNASATLPPLSLNTPAYCIYTSGSTGHPKGVLIDHRNIVDFFEGTEPVYDVGFDSVCASFSPLHFDVFLMDMLFPLAQGARLHVHNDIVVPDLLFETVQANEVTHFSAWGMMLGLIAQADAFAATALPRLKTVLTGTDIPNIDTVQRWLRKNIGVKVINAYGPTEVTCAATAYEIREIEPGRRQLYPIGKPLMHVEAILIGGDSEQITQANETGELLLGGTQVMRGYWNLLEETAARLTHLNGVRYYRTGDICKYLEDGSLFYVGRKDNEVNIGGYRVHLNEVRRVINSVPQVHDSEIVLLDSKYGEKILAAGILLDKCSDLHVDRKIEQIHHRLGEELPSYMKPRYLAILDQLPQLSSGKPDRKQLLSILETRINGKTEEVINTHGN